MSTDVVMPQMGESIAEGTVVRWIKKVGDKVDRDEPLFEISTDKVDAEVPSPSAGVVSEIRVREGETVPVNSIVAVIGQAGEAVAARPPNPSPQADGARTSAASVEVPQNGPQSQTSRSSADLRPPPASTDRPRLVERGEVHPTPPEKSEPTEDAIRQRSSPLVRKIAKDNNV